MKTLLCYTWGRTYLPSFKRRQTKPLIYTLQAIQAREGLVQHTWNTELSLKKKNKGFIHIVVGDITYEGL